MCSGGLNFNPRWILKRPINHPESFDNRFKNSDTCTIRMTSRGLSPPASPWRQEKQNQEQPNSGPALGNTCTVFAIARMKRRIVSIPRPNLHSPSAPAVKCREPPRLPDCERVRDRPSSLTRAVPRRSLGRDGPCRDDAQTIYSGFGARQRVPEGVPIKVFPSAGPELGCS